jgi:hypothetical protein
MDPFVSGPLKLPVQEKHGGGRIRIAHPICLERLAIVVDDDDDSGPRYIDPTIPNLSLWDFSLDAHGAVAGSEAGHCGWGEGDGGGERSGSLVRN